MDSIKGGRPNGCSRSLGTHLGIAEDSGPLGSALERLDRHDENCEAVGVVVGVCR